MNAYTNGPIHDKATIGRPTFTRSTAADQSLGYFGLLRSSCGHVLGLAAVWRGRQWVLQWARCR